jgi:hypothetical protein
MHSLLELRRHGKGDQRSTNHQSCCNSSINDFFRLGCSPKPDRGLVKARFLAVEPIENNIGQIELASRLGRTNGA